jgi:hypothetical protein
VAIAKGPGLSNRLVNNPDFRVKLPADKKLLLVEKAQAGENQRCQLVHIDASIEQRGWPPVPHLSLMQPVQGLSFSARDEICGPLLDGTWE